MLKLLKIVLLVVFSISLLCGFSFHKKNKEKPYVIFSASKINKDVLQDCKTLFEKGEVINYLVYVPEGFKDDFVRIQILKKDTKVDFAGYSVKYTQDREVVKNSKQFSGQITFYESGTYVIQVIDFSNPYEAAAAGAFKIE